MRNLAHLAKDVEKLADALSAQVGTIDDTVGEITVRTALSLQRMFVRTPGRPMRRPVDIEPTNGPEPLDIPG